MTNNTNLSRKRSYERQDFPHIPTKRKMDNLPPRFQRQRQVTQHNYNPTRQNTMNACYPEQQMNTMRRTSQTWQGQPCGTHDPCTKHVNINTDDFKPCIYALNI